LGLGKYFLETAIRYKISDLYSFPMEVDSKTVGQFTGLLDKNGKKVFERDLVKHDAWDYPFEVIFNNELARFVCKLKTGLTQYIECEKVEIIGNIHEGGANE
jgi:hypothetical protein